jgi:hypothetical protein
VKAIDDEHKRLIEQIDALGDPNKSTLIVLKP